MVQGNVVRHAVDHVLGHAHVGRVGAIDGDAQPLPLSALDIGDELVTLLDTGHVFANLVGHARELVSQCDWCFEKVPIFLDQ